MGHNEKDSTIVWKVLGKGAYNTAYYTPQPIVYPPKSGAKPQQWVYKKQITSAYDDSKLDKPQRSLRVWQEINASYPAYAYQNGWICPYLGEESPSDAAIAQALIKIYQRTGRVVADACGFGNFRLVGGEAVCVDIGLAVNGRKSLDSKTAFAGLRSDFFPYWNSHEATMPQTVKTIKALMLLNESTLPPTGGLLKTLVNEPNVLTQLAEYYNFVSKEPVEELTENLKEVLHEIMRERIEKCLNLFMTMQQNACAEKLASVQSFCVEVRNKLSTLKIRPDDAAYFNQLNHLLMHTAKKNFLHDDKMLRVFLDILFVPLGVLSGGALFVLKKYYTGACLFSTANTQRGIVANQLFQLPVSRR